MPPSRPPAESADRTPRFWEVALANDLVTLAQVEAAETALRPRPDLVDAPPKVWDKALAEKLVGLGALTRFQARELLAGRTVFRLGAYLVLEEIGRGGMGQVFKAEHELMGRLVAVKVLPRSKWTPESEAAFRREMRIVGRLDHPNLVHAYDAGYEKQVNYLVTELVPGLDLRKLIRQHGPINEREAASVFSQVAAGLAYAHAQGLVHRDVKPGNILVMEDGRVKVLDMGLAGSTLEAEAVRLGRVVGTMDYIAPEQIRTPDDVGPAADIYGLGCSIYFAVSGQVPFPDGTRREKMQRHLNEQPAPLRTLAPQVSEAFCLLVEKMMEKSPTHRIGDATEVVQRLRRWMPPSPLPLPRPLGEEKASRRPWFPRLAIRRAASRRQPAAGQGGAGIAAWLEQTGAAGRRVALATLLPAALAGGLFAGVMWGVRAFARGRFDDVFGPSAPLLFGAAAFGLVLLIQMLSLMAEREGD